MCRNLWLVTLISFIIASLTLQAALNTGMINLNMYSNETAVAFPSTTSSQRFVCHYAGMWCSCYANSRGGCAVSCSPNVYKVLYNQTDCPQLLNFILAGFTVF